MELRAWSLESAGEAPWSWDSDPTGGGISSRHWISEGTPWVWFWMWNHHNLESPVLLGLAATAVEWRNVAGAVLIGTGSKQRRNPPSPSNPHIPCGIPSRLSLTRSQLEKEKLLRRGSAPAWEADCEGGEKRAETSGSITSEPPGPGSVSSVGPTLYFLWHSSFRGLPAHVGMRAWSPGQ